MVVGAKQTMRMLEKGRLSEVYLAKDADRFVTKPLQKMATDKGVRIVFEDSRVKLGHKCGIDIGAAVAGRLV